MNPLETLQAQALPFAKLLGIKLTAAAPGPARLRALDFAAHEVHMRAKPPSRGYWRSGRVKGFSVRLPSA